MCCTCGPPWHLSMGLKTQLSLGHSGTFNFVAQKPFQRWWDSQLKFNQEEYFSLSFLSCALYALLPFKQLRLCSEVHTFYKYCHFLLLSSHFESQELILSWCTSFSYICFKVFTTDPLKSRSQRSAYRISFASASRNANVNPQHHQCPGPGVRPNKL